jgi:hypothetical protein
MTSSTSPTLADDLTALLRARPGKPPAADALSHLGGWARVATDVAATANTPALVSLVALAARDAATPSNRTDSFPAAINAIAAAVTATTSPALFADSLNILLDCPAALAETRADLAAELEQIVRDCLKFHNASPPTTQRAADALEALTRLNLIEGEPPYDLLALLNKFSAPVAKPLAIAAIRAVSTAIDHWPHATSLTRVIRLLAGIDKPKITAQPEIDPEDVASDAAWALAGAELIGALRASDLPEMAAKLHASATHLQTARDNYEREDAAVLLTVVELLLSLLQETGVAPAVEALTTPHLQPDALDALAERVRRLNVASIGLNHWYGDPKRAALDAWNLLANDLARLRIEFDRKSFYKAAVVVDHLLQIYMGSRSVKIVRFEDDVDGLMSLVQPIIETGFAKTAGLLSHLDDHTRALQRQVDEATTPEQRLVLHEQLRAARNMLIAAQTHALGGAGQGKGDGGTADQQPLPPPLSQLVPPGSVSAAELSGLSQPALIELARAVDNRTIGSRSLNLVETDVFTAIRTALGSSPDYRGEAAESVDLLLRIVIRFVTTRTNAQSDLYSYLFDKEAKEDAIHKDLYNYLTSSELGSLVEFEVQHIGGGRIDLRLKFGGFGIYIEMKVDSTKVPLGDKTAYLKQAAAYQVTDIRIGFLIALRHKIFDPTGPPPHLSELIGHAKFDIKRDPTPRHIITVQVPGSRTKPSDMR